jgi:hypothetical protein
MSGEGLTLEEAAKVTGAGVAETKRAWADAKRHYDAERRQALKRPRKSGRKKVKA